MVYIFAVLQQVLQNYISYCQLAVNENWGVFCSDYCCGDVTVPVKK